MKRTAAYALARALESGKYRQISRRLGERHGRTIKNCCLGVECRISGIRGMPTGSSHVRLTYDNHEECLPESIQELHNWQSPDGRFQDGGIEYDGKYHMSLMSLNDAGAPFKFIAKVIRQKWRVL
jgi:hypothetical protein